MTLLVKNDSLVYQISMLFLLVELRKVFIVFTTFGIFMHYKFCLLRINLTNILEVILFQNEITSISFVKKIYQ